MRNLILIPVILGRFLLKKEEQKAVIREKTPFDLLESVTFPAMMKLIKLFSPPRFSEVCVLFGIITNLA